MKPLFPGLPVKMLALFLLVLVIPLKAAISKEKSHIRTLVIVSHPYPERSVMKWSTKTGHRVRVFPVSVF
ncbi:hypothetical protein [Klebsiella variicola]|uniref:hypothetical protein n=1 Tax=Klebsiella variicola TaxID=244366 RepID=UPI001F544652|nr:hypothetical protein [Klebsiella variicola]